ncbi:hypothetical protein XENORESO_007690, partial [Xenotaenia resolanae]
MNCRDPQVIKNPPKDRRVSDVLGQITLLYHRRLMLEIDQRVKLQFELNDTLQMVDVLRGELTEVGNRLETVECSQATPPSLEEWGGEKKPTSQVETFEGEPYLRYPERTCRSDLEDVEAALQRLPFQARGVPHTSTE